MATIVTDEAPVSEGVASYPFDIDFPISVETYHEMIERGILGPDDRVELIEGILVKKMAKNEAHIYANGQLIDLLPPLLGAIGFLNDQQPIVCTDSEPEPDISIIRGNRQQSRGRKPRPHDVLLLIEIADTSRAKDKGARKTLYARERIAQYWVVNLIDKQIEVYSRPSAETEPDYLDRQVYAAGHAVPLILDGIEVGRIHVSDLLM